MPYMEGRTALCCWVFYLIDRVLGFRVSDSEDSEGLTVLELQGDLRPSGFGIRSFRFDLHFEGSKSY